MLTVIAIWIALSIPGGLIVGRFINAGMGDDYE